MQRKRGELVPIGEVVADLDGPVKAIREASPQARHHFTRFDQVNQLVGASEADPDLGFMGRTMAFGFAPNMNDNYSYREGFARPDRPGRDRDRPADRLLRRGMNRRRRSFR